MKEFKIREKNVKMKEYVPFTDMGAINLYGLYYIQTKQAEIVKKYIDKCEKKAEEESPQEYDLRIQKTMNQKDREAMEKYQMEYIPYIQPLLSVILISPKLEDFTMGEGMELFKHPVTSEILMGIMQDLRGGMEPPEPSKKV